MLDSMVIDLRSDTVTRPSPGMLEAMAQAELGDDVYGEDPTVNELEAYAAELGGKESALFLPTATQANLSAILSVCESGDEYIAGDQAHCYLWEAGGAAVLGSVQPQPLPFEEDGTLDLEKVAACLKPDDPHFARSRLLCLENTHMGKALPLSYLRQAPLFCREKGLSLHLDGARLFNACLLYQLPLDEVVRGFDTVTLCLSKGLGCPAGALLLGSANLIKKARRWRKALGGGMRQAGLLAAAGLYALSNQVDDLKKDHQKAEILATLIGEGASFRTNMVFFSLPAERAGRLRLFLEERGVKILTGYTKEVRLVTHRDLSLEQIERAGSLIAGFLAT